MRQQAADHVVLGYAKGMTTSQGQMAAQCAMRSALKTNLQHCCASLAIKHLQQMHIETARPHG